MHYYSHNIGDYRRDTHHLTLLEHGIYRQMLDQYYLEESPLPIDLDKLMRSLCVRNADEVQAFQNVLSDFFQKTERGYIHSRCEQELQAIYSKSEKARMAAQARWDKQNQKVTDDNNADAMRTHSERNADGMLPNTQDPLPNNTKDQNNTSVSTKPTCPHDQIIDLFVETIPELPKPVKSRWKGSKRAKDLAARWNEDDRHRDMDFWKWFFVTVKSNPFWLGDNNRGWKADLGWLVERRNFDKVIERGVNHG